MNKLTSHLRTLLLDHVFALRLSRDAWLIGSGMLICSDHFCLCVRTVRERNIIANARRHIQNRPRSVPHRGCDCVLVQRMS